MECRRLQEWLESVDSCQIADLPLNILAHSRDCKQCGNILDNVKNLETEHTSLVFPLSEIQTLKKRVQEAIQPRQGPSSQSFLDFIARWDLTWAGVLIGIILLCVVGTGILKPVFLLPDNRFSLSIVGKDGMVALNQKESLILKDQKNLICPGSLLVLEKSASYAIVTFPDEGEIEFKGNGKIQIQENGFGTRDGNFHARFHKGKNGFVASIPGAVLGIRGTVISFDFHERERIFFAELLEGSVEVRPTQPGIPAFPWNVGEKLIAGDSGVSISASVQERPVGPASESLLTPDAVRDPRTPLQMNGSQTW